MKEKGITVVDSFVDYEYGKFVNIMDPEGNYGNRSTASLSKWAV